MKVDTQRALFTVAEVIEMRREIEAAEKQFADLTVRIPEMKQEFAVLFKRLTADEKLAVYAKPKPAGAYARAGAPPLAPNGKRVFARKANGWEQGVLDTLNASEAGRHHQFILETLKQNPEIAVRMKRSTNGYYSAVKSLLDTGEIEKHGKLLYSATLANKLRAEGKPIPSEAEQTSLQGTPALIIQALRGVAPGGLDAHGILDRLAGMPDVPESLLKHQSYLYTQLGRLVRSDDLIKQGTVYYLNPSRYPMATARLPLSPPNSATH